ncbi:ROK family protein [Rhodocyclus tenuis]|uniref:ROK family protein n=1 Tax=Rhodocyclus tenuis TaxID=1066 RepID=UPI001906679B|nr:ROK family protein [Rhodocyclus tenuis]MBK1680268.1 fructokinase [Rhodocyclus tenuis]
MALRIGIDLGGSKIEVAALDATGELLLRRRVPTPTGDYAATLSAIGALVQGAEAELGARATVGIGTPGSEGGDGLLRNSNSTCLNGKPLRADLETLLGRPLRLANDANCFALAEEQGGAACGAALVFGVILGTGVGGGIVVDGRVVAGANRIAGEWGHNPLPVADGLPPPACYCGRSGCVETWLSGPGFAADHRRLGGVACSPEEIVAAAASGDARALATLARYHERLARALATVINIVDPEVIVLGGGMANLPDLADEVAKRLPAHVFSPTLATRVVRHALGDSAGVLGAAGLWSVAEAAALLATG